MVATQARSTIDSTHDFSMSVLKQIPSLTHV